MKRARSPTNLANEILSYFGDGSDWGIQMIYSVEDEPLGTAGSVKMVESYLTDTFIVINGDCLTDFDMSRALNFHREKNSIATITLARGIGIYSSQARRLCLSDA